MGEEINIQSSNLQKDEILQKSTKIKKNSTFTVTTGETACEKTKDVCDENLLKTLLFTSTALSPNVPLFPIKTVSTSVPLENMITKEVNDIQLNFKKIIYEPETEVLKDKDQDLTLQTSLQKISTDTQMDDDDRLVIDISDEESTKNNNKAKDDVNHERNITADDKPNSLTFNLDTSGVNSSCVKIDVLTPYSAYMNNAKESKSNELLKQNRTISLTEELSIISHEIDKQINKKTNEILDLIKNYLECVLTTSSFHSKMIDIGNISISDLLTISKKLIRRYKFEPNPNQKDFVKIKNLHFPTSGQDLINYFANVLPTLEKNKFLKMATFYHLIIKEMLKQNKTKILQYIIDFMIRRRNEHLDMLSYNFETNAFPNFKESKSSLSSSVEIPDSTQNTKIEKKNTRNTSYNFVVRSDPIYQTAGTFSTNHLDVIKCQTTPLIQKNSFDRKPFDNNILKGRRIIRRIASFEKDENKSQGNISTLKNRENKLQERLSSHLAKIQKSSEKTSINNTDFSQKISSSHTIGSKQHETKCKSPIILVESDTTSLSPPRELKQTEYLEERKKAYQTITSNNCTLFRDSSLFGETTSYNQIFTDSVIKGRLSMNEIKTLNQNGTEIIPTTNFRRSITTRRKTIDVDHTSNFNNLNLEKSYPLQNQKAKSPNTQLTTKTALDYIHSQSSMYKQSNAKIFKRRQSCHERIFVSSVANVIGTTINNADSSRCKYNDKKNAHALLLEKNDIQDAHNSHDLQQKRPRFTNDVDTNLKDLTVFARAKKNINDDNIQSTFQKLSSSDQPALKSFPLSIDYHQYQLYFERELRERGYVDRIETLQDTESTEKLCRPLELVSHVPPEHYFQNQETTRSAFSSPKTSGNFDKVGRSERTPITANDEKATIVAFHQLQSLHKDPNYLSAKQYSDQLKQLYQMKQAQSSSNTSTVTFQNQLNNFRESIYKNSRTKISQHENFQQLESDQPFNFSQYDVTQTQNKTEHQSLQRKLKLKAKSSKYIEPSQQMKTFYRTPHSTHYADPYASTIYNKKSTFTTVSNAQDRIIDDNSQSYVPYPPFYNLRNDCDSNFAYQLMLAKQHQQNSKQNQIARPIPRQALSNFRDTTFGVLSSNQNPFSQNSSQGFQNQQSEFYRQCYNPKNY